MNPVFKSFFLIIAIPLLSACGGITPAIKSTRTTARAPAGPTQTEKPAPTFTSVRPSPTPSPEATSTLTPVLSTSSATHQRDLVEETREAEAFCYQDPRKALDDYLTFLYQGEYEKAARLYDSSYPFERRRITPEALEPSERLVVVADFLRDFCQGYATCLQHRIVNWDILSYRSKFSERIKKIPEGEVMIFGVNFFWEDGEIFESIPPAGVPGDRVTLIGFIVAKLDGCYKNIDTPPMTP